ncbi:MAG: rhamnulokinase family protein [Clostridia bacterium]
MKNFLAIDVGASSGRGIVYSWDGAKFDTTEVLRFENLPIWQDGDFKWDSGYLFGKILASIENAHAQFGRVDSLAIDTWGVDYGLIDTNGKLVTEPFHYRDRRTSGIIDRFDTMTRKELYSTAGISFNEFNTAYQLSCEKKNIFDDVQTFLFMPDLFGYMLTGEMATEPTIASTSAIYRKGKGFCKQFFKKCEIPYSICPAVKPTGSILGNVRREFLDKMNINYDIPVVLGCGHDTSCAVLSLPYSDGDTLFLSSGTWSLFGVEREKPLINATTMQENYSNELAYGERTQLLKNIMGLWIVQECRREWRKTNNDLSFPQIVDECLKAQPLKAFIDVGDMIFNSPDNMPQKICRWVERTQGVTLNSIGEIARCAYESLALEYRFAFEGLQKITKKTYPSLTIIGGGVKNKFLNQCVANSLGIKVFCGDIEATALGNALCQLACADKTNDMRAIKAKLANGDKAVCMLPTDCDEWTKAYSKYLKLKQI